MKRIDLIYNAHPYSMPDADLDEVMTRILAGLAGEPFWLSVNQGAGSYQEAHLLISPGVSISVVGIDAD